MFHSPMINTAQVPAHKLPDPDFSEFDVVAWVAARFAVTADHARVVVEHWLGGRQ
jgi:hypothetical protein